MLSPVKTQHVHAFETSAPAVNFKATGDIFVIPSDLHFFIKIYSKTLYYLVKSGTSYKIERDYATTKPDLSSSYWLYFVLDRYASPKFYKTYVNPVLDSFGRDFPGSPQPGQLFFNQNISRRFVWNGLRWVECDAVVIGKFDEGGNCINLYSRQSQGGFKQGAYIADHIYLTKDAPVLVFESDGYSFLTQKEATALTFSVIENLRIDTLLHRTRAYSDLNKFTAIVRRSDGLIDRASTSEDDEAVAITVQECKEGEDCLIIEKGYVYDRTKQWPHPANSRLYYGHEGSLTTLAPSLKTSRAVQEMGHVVDIYTIYIDPREKIILGRP